MKQGNSDLRMTVFPYVHALQVAFVNIVALRTYPWRLIVSVRNCLASFTASTKTLDRSSSRHSE